MKRSDKKLILMCMMLLSVCGSNLASAEIRRAPAASGSAQAPDAAVQNLLKKVTAEKDQALVHGQELEKRVADLEKQLALAKQKSGSNEETLGKYKEVYGEATSRITEMQGKMKELIAKFRANIVDLKAAEQEKARLSKALEEKEAMLAEQEKNNQRLQAINLELIDKYKNKGVLDALLQKEPVTQIKRVNVENETEKYRNEMEDMVAVDASRQ